MLICSLSCINAMVHINGGHARRYTIDSWLFSLQKTQSGKSTKPPTSLWNGKTFPKMSRSWNSIKFLCRIPQDIGRITCNDLPKHAFIYREGLFIRQKPKRVPELDFGGLKNLPGSHATEWHAPAATPKTPGVEKQKNMAQLEDLLKFGYPLGNEHSHTPQNGWEPENNHRRLKSAVYGRGLWLFFVPTRVSRKLFFAGEILPKRFGKKLRLKHAFLTTLEDQFCFTVCNGCWWQLLRFLSNSSLFDGYFEPQVCSGLV